MTMAMARGGMCGVRSAGLDWTVPGQWVSLRVVSLSCIVWCGVVWRPLDLELLWITVPFFLSLIEKGFVWSCDVM